MAPSNGNPRAGRLRSAPVVSLGDERLVSPWERLEAAAGDALPRNQTAYAIPEPNASRPPRNISRRASLALFSTANKADADPKLPGKAERILAPGIARAFEPRSGLRTMMSMQTAQQEPGLAGLRQRMSTRLVPDPKEQHVAYNGSSSLERISESVGAFSDEDMSKPTSPRVKSIIEENIASLEETSPSFEHPTDETGQPILPMHKGGEGIRRLVRTRERDRRIFGLPTDYWHISLIALRGRAWPIWPQIIYTLYSILVVVLIVRFVPDYQKNSHFIGFQNLITTMGLALFLLLTFRTNSSYERWWEGRKLWDGINSKIDNLTRLALVWVGPKDPSLAVDIIRWSLAFAYLIKDELRSKNEHPELVGILTADELHELDWSVHQPISKCSIRISELLLQSNVGPAKVPNVPILASLDNSITGLVGDAIACQRILATPMPFAYVVHLRSFIVLWLLGLPLAFIPYQGYWTIIICVVVGYELLGFESIGVEVENPFGTDFNDLPLDSITLELYAKSRAALLNLGFEMDLTSRVMADPLFAKCYYAASHQSHFKVEGNHSIPAQQSQISSPSNTSDEGGPPMPSVAIPILEPMLQNQAPNRAENGSTKHPGKPSTV